MVDSALKSLFFHTLRGPRLALMRWENSDQARSPCPERSEAERRPRGRAYTSCLIANLNNAMEYAGYNVKIQKLGDVHRVSMYPDRLHSPSFQSQAPGGG